MHTPKTEEYLYMEMFSHSDEQDFPSLDTLATKIYGREYKGQQTGDMIGNDSHILYNMDEDEVNQYLYDLAIIPDDEGNFLPKRHYLKWDRIKSEAVYVEGVNWFEYWLALPELTEPYNDYAYREAPTPEYVLADLIHRGELPHGKYLLHVWW